MFLDVGGERRDATLGGGGVLFRLRRQPPRLRRLRPGVVHERSLRLGVLSALLPLGRRGGLSLGRASPERLRLGGEIRLGLLRLRLERVKGGLHLLDGGVVRLRDGAVVGGVALRGGRSLARGGGVLTRAHGGGEELHLPRRLRGAVLGGGDHPSRLRRNRHPAGRAPARGRNPRRRLHGDAHALVRLLELLLQDLALLLRYRGASLRVGFGVSKRGGGGFVRRGSRRRLLRRRRRRRRRGARALALRVEVGPGGGPVLLQAREFRRESFALGANLAFPRLFERQRRVSRGFDFGLFRGGLRRRLRGALLRAREELALGVGASRGGFGAGASVLGGVEASVSFAERSLVLGEKPLRLRVLLHERVHVLPRGVRGLLQGGVPTALEFSLRPGRRRLRLGGGGGASVLIRLLAK